MAMDDVQRVVRAVAVTRVPGAARCLLGMIDLHGQPVPVFDTRALFGLPTRPLAETDVMVITRSAQPRAFVADQVLDTFEYTDLARPRSFAAGLTHLRGVARRDDGMVFVHDMKRFISMDLATPLVALHG